MGVIFSPLLLALCAVGTRAAGSLTLYIYNMLMYFTRGQKMPQQQSKVRIQDKMCVRTTLCAPKWCQWQSISDYSRVKLTTIMMVMDDDEGDGDVDKLRTLAY